MSTDKGCDAPGHENCSGWILCDHLGVELEEDGWCPRCDELALGPVRAWCPERIN